MQDSIIIGQLSCSSKCGRRQSLVIELLPSNEHLAVQKAELEMDSGAMPE